MAPKAILLFLGILTLGNAFVAPVSAQCPYRFAQKIFSPAPLEMEEYGTKVVFDGQTLMVGSPLNDDLSRNGGAIDIYDFDGTEWVFQNRINSFNPRNFDRLGEQMEVEGARLAIGFTRRDEPFSDSGGALVYRKVSGQWTLEQVLSAPQPQANDFMGWSVSLEGDFLAVSIPYDDDLAVNAGTVQFYRHDGTEWQHDGEVFASDARMNALFGWSIDSEDGVLVVGSPEDTTGGHASGSTYVFRNQSGTWEEIQKIVSPDPGVNERFGISVEIDGDTICVGSHGDEGGSHQGAVYVYVLRDGTYEFVQKLTASDGGAGQRFGTSISLDKRRLLVGAGGNQGAAAYLYRQATDGTFGDEQKLGPDPAPATDNFGISVALFGPIAVVGAHRDDGQGADAGATYVFTRRGDAAFAMEGTVNAGIDMPRNVLFLNGKAKEGESRVIEFEILEPFTLEMRRPPALAAPEVAPFALYAWAARPDQSTTRTLPLGIGCAALPMPLTGGEPQPQVIWNNAMRTRHLGVPTRSSLPAPSIVLDQRDGLRRVASFCVQGLIYDPGSAGEVPASVTNAIIGVPVFGGR